MEPQFSYKSILMNDKKGTLDVLKILATLSVFLLLVYIGTQRNFFHISLVHASSSLPSSTPISTTDMAGRGYSSSPIRVIAVGSNKIAVAGYYYDPLGPYIGASAVFNASTGAFSNSFPMIPDGEVEATISDGNGGFYVGGYFRQVGSYTRYCLAHINSDGSVDTNFDAQMNSPAVSDCSVDAIQKVGSTLYIAGRFTTVGGVSIVNLASVDASTGVLLPWTPPVFGPFNARVYSMLVVGENIYIGGSFTTLDGISHIAAAQVSATTTAINSWNPVITGSFPYVDSIVMNGSVMYLGGAYTSVGGVARNGLSAVDASTGAVFPWTPFSIGSSVFKLLLDGTTLYVGGNYNTIAGATRHSMSSFDVSSSTSPTLNSGFDPSGSNTASVVVNGLEAGGSNLYVTGAFGNGTRLFGGQTRYFAAEINKTTGVATSWAPVFGGPAGVMARSGSNILVGNGGPNLNAGFYTGGGTYANSDAFAIIDGATGHVTSYRLPSDFNCPDCIETMVFDGADTLYVGGSFSGTYYNGTPVSRLFAIDLSTGNLLAGFTPPTIDSDVLTMKIANGKLYIGGWFGTVGGTTRNYVAALNKTTGTLDALFNPNANSRVTTLDVSGDGSTVYLGGVFSTMGGVSRNRVASVDAVTGAVTSFNPVISGCGPTINSIAVSGSYLYVGGCFSTVGGLTRTNAVELDTTATSTYATSMLINTDSDVLSLGVSNGELYVGGYFDTVNGVANSSLAAFDTASHTLETWPANISYDEFSSFGFGHYVKQLGFGGGAVYAVGSFTSANGTINGNSLLGGVVRQNFAQFGTFTPAIAAVVPTVAFTTTSSTVSESAGSTTLPVSLSATTTAVVTVSYAVTGGTAVSGTNYTLASGTLTFSAGTSATTIPVTILNTAFTGTAKTVIVTLSNPSNGTLGTNTAYTLSITGSGSTATPAPAPSFPAGGNGPIVQNNPPPVVSTTTPPVISLPPVISPSVLNVVLEIAKDTKNWKSELTGTLLTLKGVDVRMTVGGTATGPIDYSIDCNNDGSIDAQVTQSSKAQITFPNVCNYTKLGQHTIHVIVTRGGLVSESTAVVTVIASPNLAAQCVATATAKRDTALAVAKKTYNDLVAQIHKKYANDIATALSENKNAAALANSILATTSVQNLAALKKSTAEALTVETNANKIHQEAIKKAEAQHVLDLKNANALKGTAKTAAVKAANDTYTAAVSAANEAHQLAQKQADQQKKAAQDAKIIADAAAKEANKTELDNLKVQLSQIQASIKAREETALQAAKSWYDAAVEEIQQNYASNKVDCSNGIPPVTPVLPVVPSISELIAPPAGNDQSTTTPVANIHSGANDEPVILEPAPDNSSVVSTLVHAVASTASNFGNSVSNIYKIADDQLLLLRGFEWPKTGTVDVLTLLAALSLLVLAPTATAVAYREPVMQIATGVNSSNDFFLLMTKAWNNLFFLLGIRHRKKYWGTVYDSRTKQPIDPVLVELIDASTGLTIEETITDMAGRFGFLVRPGKFIIKASKTHYAFPSKELPGEMDEIFDHLYHGEVIEIINKDEVLVPNIPMDALAFDWNQMDKQRIVKFHPVRNKIIDVVASTFFWAGFAITILNYLAHPIVWYAFWVVCYFLILVFTLLEPRTRLWGTLHDKLTHASLAGVLVELTHPYVTTVVIGKAKTDRNGKFFLKGNPGTYTLIAKKTTSDAVAELGSAQVEIESMGVVNKDVIV